MLALLLWISIPATETPLHPSRLVRWRNRVGNKFDALLKQTIELALNTKAMSLRELEDVNVDTTVQEKAIIFPTDAKFYHKIRDLLVSAAQNSGTK